MGSKNAIIYSGVLKKTHRNFRLFKEMAQSFGYELLFVDSTDKTMQYIKEGDTGAIFCDDLFFYNELKKVFEKSPVLCRNLPIILLITDLSQSITYESNIDSLLILSLPKTVFELSAFTVFKYLSLKEKLNTISGVTNPDFIKKLLSDTAHAINNILTGMQGYAELAQLNPEDKKLIHDSFQVVLDSSYRARNEIKNMRTFARIETPQIEPVVILDVLREAKELAKTRIQAKGMKLVENLKSKSLINGDYDQLVQVFFNLLYDVINNIKEKSTIQLTQKEEDNMVMVSIEGKNCIIDANDVKSLERVFAFNEPVLKVDSKEGRIENRNVLSICNRIIHNHQGTILLKKEDDFFTYRVRIPTPQKLYDVLEKERVTTKEAYESLEDLDMDILVVDDEEYVRNTIYYFFNKKGCRVTLAEDGEYGLNVAKQKPFDLIFMDYLMPKMGGIEAARRILENNSEVKIVFITGRDPLNEQEIYRSGVYAIINKPFEMKDLYSIAKKVALQKGIID